MSRSLSSAVMFCLVLMLFLSLPSGPMAADFTGEWQGSWVSEDGESTGGLSGNFAQAGSTLTGTMSFRGTDCGDLINQSISDGQVAGSYASGAVTAYCADPYVSAFITVEFYGTLSGQTYSGNYYAYLTESEEGVDYGSFSMNRTSVPVNADFSGSPTTGPAALTVNFTDMSSGQITTYSWQFGDGGTSSLQNPSHVYNTPGTYNVTLDVSGQGGSDSETKYGYITVSQPIPPPVADFSGSPTSDLAPATVDFTDMSTGTVTGWSWAFEGGEPGTSTQQNPSNILFLLPGTYTVTLTVTGPGGSDAETKTGYITVEDPRPVADFSADPTSGLAPLSVQFTDLSTGNVTSRTWNFGDGQTSTASNPLHVYQNPGPYTVSLTVSGPVPSLPPSNGTKTRAAYITVTTPPPVAKFTANPLHGAAPLDVQFTDQSTGDITSRTWNFGGGTEVEAGLNPKRRYDAIGPYHITLQVTGPGGTSDASADVLAYQIMYASKNDASCGGKSPCRTSLQSAFNDAAQYALIKATQDTYGENVSFSSQQQKIVMFQGGYNAAFDASSGFTTANQMSVGGSATLMAEKLQLQGGAALGASAGSTDGMVSCLSDASSAAASEEPGRKRSGADSAAGYPSYRDNKTGEQEASTEGLYGKDVRNALVSTIARIYKAALGREPSADEIEAALDYAMGISKAYNMELKYALWDIASSLFSARLCPGRECLSEEAVSLAYTAILGREALPEEKVYWLQAPAGINSILFALAGSEEFMKAGGVFKRSSEVMAGNALCAAYIALLDRLPKEGEFDSWAGLPVGEILSGLLDSDEIRSKGLTHDEIELKLLLLENDVSLNIK